MFPLAAKQCRRLSCQRSEGVSHESLAAYVHRQCKVSQSSPRWVFSHTYDPPWYLTWKDFEECHCASALRQHSVEYFWERLRGVCRCRTKYNVEEKEKKKKKERLVWGLQSRRFDPGSNSRRARTRTDATWFIRAEYKQNAGGKYEKLSSSYINLH